MKKILLSTVALATALAAMAVPAKQSVYHFVQTDGTTINVSRAGDEWHSSYVTTDGYTVARDAKGDFYYRDINGLTAVKAHNPEGRSADENSYLATVGSGLTLKATLPETGRKKARMNSERRKLATDVPQKGSPRVPVVLVQYSDVKLKDDPVTTFTAQFTEGATSAYQYFYDQSFGAYQPQFDVLGPVTLSRTRAYYGAHSGNSNDVRLGAMVAEGCQGLSGVDWSRYDNDGDGKVDVVVVLYAGVGEADSDVDEAIWPCQWYLSSSDYKKSLKIGGTTIDKFAVFNELLGADPNRIDGIGTFCHEFSHCLGLPDFYPTDYSNHFGMGSWSLLHYGCYANQGYTPCGYTAYERNFMGWYDIDTPEPNTTYTLNPITPTLKGKSYRVQSDYNANEYYILENRQRTGWDAFLPASGLQVTHVYYNASRWNGNTVNNYNEQGMTIIPADNSLKTVGSAADGYSFDYNDQVGDLFPYKNAKELTDESVPAATLYKGNFMGKPITNITKSGNQVSFTYIPYIPFIPDVPVAQVSADEITADGFTATWTSVNRALSYVMRVNKPAYLVTETFAKCTAASTTAITSMDKYADEAGWLSTTAYPEVGGIRLGNNSKVGAIRTAYLDLSQTTGDVTVVVKAKSYGSDSNVSLSVMRFGDAESVQTAAITAEEQEYTFTFNDLALDAAPSFSISNVNKGKRAVVTGVKIYAGSTEASGSAPLTIEGITSERQQVTGLKAATEYLFNVRSVGSEGMSEWSNTVFVTTAQSATLPGDVNGDGNVNGADVTALYNFLLNGTPVPGEPDVTADGNVNGSDVTALYNLLLK